MRNDYIPYPARIVSARDETYDTKTFRLKFTEPSVAEDFNFKQGQFLEVSLLGRGEAPISICSSPLEREYFELNIRSVGSLTGAICRLKEGDILYVRGPYGNSFPFKEVKGRDLVFIAGGIGLAPLRGLIQMVLKNKKDFGNVSILYGAKSPEDLCFRDELEQWSEVEGTSVYQTVDRASDGWNGRVGLVTELYEAAGIEEGAGEMSNTTAFLCGPPVMIRFAARKLKACGFKPGNIYVTLERYMKCGIGKCGHCNIGGVFVCVDGPVFSWEHVEGFTEDF